MHSVRSCRQRFWLVSFLIAIVPSTLLAVGFDETYDAKVLSEGNLAEFKRILANDSAQEYKDPRIIGMALPTAVSSGNVELVRYLASLGWINTCRADPNGCYLVLVAARYGNVDMLKFLIFEEGLDAKIVSPGRETAMHRAASGGWLEAVKYLCIQGVSSMVKNEEGRTALDKAKSAVRRMDPSERVRGSKVVEYLESGQCEKDAQR